MRWKALIPICLTAICWMPTSAAIEDPDPICATDPETGERKCVDGPDPVGVDDLDPMVTLILRTHSGDVVISEPTPEAIECARNPDACTIKMGSVVYGACDSTGDCRAEIAFVCTDRNSAMNATGRVTITERADGAGSCEGTCSDGHTVLILCVKREVRQRPLGLRR